MNSYVIIGNGTASIGCIEGIRSTDKEGSITVISNENHHVYGRPLISYYLENKTGLENMKYRDSGFYERMKTNVIYGKKAEKIDKDKKEVLLDDGRKINYSSLLVATGSSAFTPPFKGLESVGKKFTFMTLDDAIALKNEVHENSRVLIIGAGLIGLKCCEGLYSITKNITVCDLSERVLSSILDKDCAHIVQEHLEKKNIKFLLGDSVEHFEKNKAFMNSKKEIDFDILVLAVGVRPNVSLIKDMEGEVDRGILVNKKMETSVENIYAAGDCTQGYDMLLDENRILAILPNAYMGGYTAGINMAGGDSQFDKGIPMNSIGFFGLHMMSAGIYDGDMKEEKTESGLKRFFIKNNRLIGFMIIGDVQRAGIYTSLIREKTDLRTIDFTLLRHVASTIAFSKQERGKKFGGVV